ncbi:MAG: hypothetical protein IJM25_10900 [Eubacterium sp.]|nr:hypothetical protein [Eubacterium sp.]
MNNQKNIFSGLEDKIRQACFFIECRNCTFDKNRGTFGGAIRSWQLRIYNCTFKNNYASELGGALYTINGESGEGFIEGNRSVMNHTLLLQYDFDFVLLFVYVIVELNCKRFLQIWMVEMFSTGIKDRLYFS